GNRAGDEHVAGPDGRRGAFEDLVLERRLPEHLAIGGVYRHEAELGEKDRLPSRPFTGGDGRGITGPVIEHAPQHFAVALAEGHDGRASGADIEQDTILLDQRRARRAKQKRFRLELLDRVNLPELSAFGDVEA